MLNKEFQRQEGLLDREVLLKDVWADLLALETSAQFLQKLFKRFWGTDFFISFVFSVLSDLVNKLDDAFKLVLRVLMDTLFEEKVLEEFVKQGLNANVDSRERDDLYFK